MTQVEERLLRLPPQPAPSTTSFPPPDSYADAAGEASPAGSPAGANGSAHAAGSASSNLRSRATIMARSATWGDGDTPRCAVRTARPRLVRVTAPVQHCPSPGQAGLPLQYAHAQHAGGWCA